MSLLTDNLYKSSCFFIDVYDPLELYIQDETFGSIALLTINYYNFIQKKLGQKKLDICILKHYACNPLYTKIFKIFHLKHKGIFINDVIHYKMSLNILAKKKLRIILGQESYFKNYTEIFIRHDLNYIIKLQNDGKCIHLILPKGDVCIFCKDFHGTKFHGNFLTWCLNNISVNDDGGEIISNEICYTYWCQKNFKGTHYSPYYIHPGYMCNTHGFYNNPGNNCPCIIKNHACNQNNNNVIQFNLEYLHPELTQRL